VGFIIDAKLIKILAARKKKRVFDSGLLKNKTQTGRRSIAPPAVLLYNQIMNTYSFASVFTGFSFAALKLAAVTTRAVMAIAIKTPKMNIQGLMG